MRRPHATLAVTLSGMLPVVGLVIASSEGCAYDWVLPAKDAVDGGGDGSLEASAADALADASTSAEGGSKSCRANSDCDAAQYCRFADHACGKGQTGACAPTAPASCTTTDWVCGCSGNVYKCLGEATAARDDVSATAACAPPPPLSFRCGTLFCTETKTFCVTTKKDQVAEFKCVDFAGCGADNCSCSATTSLGCSSCDGSKVGQVQVTCP
jgi:hypothetical protein